MLLSISDKLQLQKDNIVRIMHNEKENYHLAWIRSNYPTVEGPSIVQTANLKMFLIILLVFMRTIGECNVTTRVRKIDVSDEQENWIFWESRGHKIFTNAE